MNRKYSSPLSEDTAIHTSPRFMRKMASSRKKYNVAKEYDMKLSTCKAILQVYLKEGRIGKKATRDRKSKIINTIIIATINPLNPLQSSIVPYVSISEMKSNSKEESQSEMLSEALMQANFYFQNIMNNGISANNNSSQQQEQFQSPNYIDIGEDYKKMLQNTLMNSQINAISQIYLRNQINSNNQQQFNQQQQLFFEQQQQPKRSFEEDIDSQKQECSENDKNSFEMEEQIESVQIKKNVENFNQNSFNARIVPNQEVISKKMIVNGYENIRRKNSIIIPPKDQEINIEQNL